jgi:RecB family endonuclease NucS
MISGVALHETSNGWEFISEAALEKFVWTSLTELFELTPLKQQYNCNGEICDIIAIDKDKGLVILELKNVEDRYLIQQLTRYYANLTEEKPFSQEVDYSLPVQLIAITPSYHRHNLIDRAHSRLNFTLFNFSVLREEERFHFLLQEVGKEFIHTKHLIQYQPIELSSSGDIPDPPEQLLKWLGGCAKQEQEGILQVRNKILSCSQRMKEIAEKKSIFYGSGKTRVCAEICFQQSSQKPILFLWLPTPSSINVKVYKADTNEIAYIKKPIIGRLRIWTNGIEISHVGHIPDGFGKMKTIQEWEQVPQEKRPRMNQGLSSKSKTPVEIETYLRCRNNPEKPDFWDTLSSMTVEAWLKK